MNADRRARGGNARRAADSRGRRAETLARWLLRAIQLTHRQIDLFWDGAHGGFFETSGNDPSVLFRMKEHYDGAEPSGNSVAVMNLLRLAHLLDDQEFLSLAQKTLSAFGTTLEKQPVAMPNMDAALDLVHTSPLQIVVAGRRQDQKTEAILAQIGGRYLPNRVVLFLDGGEDEQLLKSEIPWIANYGMIEGQPTAYVCQNYVCDLPTSSPQKVGELIDAKSATPR